MNSTLKRKIKHAQVVSFDVFDTLLKRNCSSPYDIFDIVEKRYNIIYKEKIKEFRKERIYAEKIARELNDSGETTLDEIYTNLQMENPDILKQMEISCELDYSITNRFVKEIYDYAVNLGKIVICISDMYLSSNQINEMLIKAGYKNVSYIFVSSEFKMSKHRGNLFEKVLYKLSISNDMILHIGDNWRSDYLIPLSRGIKAYHISQGILNIKKINRREKEDTNRIFTAVINNNITTKEEKGDENYRYGYEILGPFCVEFCMWVKQQMKLEKKKTLFFCARDMHLINMIYIILFPECKKQCKYLHISRKSITYPYLYVNDSFEGFLNCLPNSKMTIEDVLTAFDLYRIESKNEIEKFGVTISKTYSKEELVQSKSFRKLCLGYILPNLKERCKEQYFSLKNYLEYLEFDCSTGLLVDVGWRGTIQTFLKDILDDSINGLYVGLRENKWDGITPNNSRTFVFDTREGINENYDLQIYSFTTLFELMLSAQHGTTIGYVNSEKHYVLGKSRNNYEIQKMQSGALAFAYDIKQYINDLDPPEESRYIDLIIKSAICPNYNNACKWGKMVNDDFIKTQFANPQPMLYYFVNPKRLKYDLDRSYWKIGFLKRLLKVDLPYFRLYRYLMNRKKVEFQGKK